MTKKKSEDTKEPKIKYILTKFDCAIAFQIIWMDERFRNEEHIFESLDGFRIMSAEHPELSETDENYEVFLWGNDSDKDKDVTTYYFEDNRFRDIYYNQLISALNYWSENWEGWIPPTAPKLSLTGINILES